VWLPGDGYIRTERELGRTMFRTCEDDVDPPADLVDPRDARARYTHSYLMIQAVAGVIGIGSGLCSSSVRCSGLPRPRSTRSSRGGHAVSALDEGLELDRREPTEGVLPAPTVVGPFDPDELRAGATRGSASAGG
jgi:hypothetical protein